MPTDPVHTDHFRRRVEDRRKAARALRRLGLPVPVYFARAETHDDPGHHEAQQ
jgi:hypothetical protein